MLIWIIVQILCCTCWSTDNGTLAQASGMHLLKSCNVCGGSHTPDDLSIPTAICPMESDLADVKANLQHLHTRLFGTRIPWQGTASLDMTPEEARSHVETIES
ncbi:hypothetical protein TNCV_1724841 [Trichonephila clavipes]|nr:hypothetical protein TNCV_1724841 [Trichonephila clavipes]